ncbi:MAG: nucleoside-triphosphatase [Ignavibacteriales bacterium]
MELHWSNLFLTGPRGAGKTTILFRALRDRRIRAGGYVVKKVYRGGRRTGMDIVDLLTGDRRRLITLVTCEDCGGVPAAPAIPVIDLEGFVSIGIPAIQSALAGGADIVVLDEIGRFELAVPEFIALVEEALDSPAPVTGVVKAESNTLLDGIRSRPDVRLVRVDREERGRAEEEYRDLLSRLV